MRRAIALTCWMLAAVPARALAAEANEAAALQAAEAWLKLIDAGRYGASWDEASTSGRKLASKQVTHELPGAPDGTYVVLVFETRFEHKERGQETVTMMLDDGRF